ncbi:MAG: LuxR C-terminal-related transcriptional regulator [Chloroflexota bacterium]
MDSDPPPLSRSFAPLSQRERDILALLAEGLSDREIAERLFVAYTTVKWHNRQIFNKLGVDSRQQAVERATAGGLLRPPTALPPPAASTRKFPAALTPFIGRLGELKALNHLLNHPNTRLVTLLAPGGMGKTRLALMLAEIAQENFPDGVAFVALAALTALDGLMMTIADTLGLQLFAERGTVEQQVRDYLRDKHLLLVLDNFEHLLEGSPQVANLLTAAAQVKVLVTSRERLNLDGETVYPLGGLPYPGQTDAENVLDYSAVQLFVECARRANSQFSAHDTASIARVCQQVQGMPLALELAAAWSGMLAPSEIAEEIARSADFLRTTMRNFPDRLRSVRAVFEATWRRLTDDERQGFQCLSVFRGGFTREAAQVIAGIDLGTLAGLVNKALLAHLPGGGRDEIHELLRQYAEEQLEASGDGEMVLAAHQTYYGRLTHEWSRALRSSKQIAALDALEVDLDNIREAFGRAIATRQAGQIEPFADLWFFFEMRARNVEGMKLFSPAVEALKGQDSMALAKCLLGMGVFYERFWDFEQERRLSQESIEMMLRLGEDRETPFARMAVGVAWINLGDAERAVSIWREGLEVAARGGDEWIVPGFLYCIGIDAMVKKNFDEAKRLITESYRIAESQGNDWANGFFSRDLGFLAFEEGNYDEAQRLFEAGVVSAQKVRHLTNVGWGLNGLRQVALAKGELQPARNYAEEAIRINRVLGDRRGLFWGTYGLAEVEIAARRYGEARDLLRDALKMFTDLANPDLIPGFGCILSQYLARTQARTEAVALISFVRHHPGWDGLGKYEQVGLERLAAQMQAELPVEVYAAAWEEGTVLALNDLIARLRALL